MKTALGVMYAFIALLILGIMVVISTAISQATSEEKSATGYFVGGMIFVVGLIGALISNLYSKADENKDK